MPDSRRLWPLCVALLAFPAQAQKRCDLLVKSTPGVPAGAACLDLSALKAGAPALQTAGNATRISTDGLTLCKSSLGTVSSGSADIVFAYDNSSSMIPRVAWRNGTVDTLFYSVDRCGA